MSNGEENSSLLARILNALDDEHGIQFGFPDENVDVSVVMFSRIGPKTPDREFIRAYSRLLAGEIGQLPGETHAVKNWEIAESDHADCEDIDGNLVNAFIVNQRCYRVTLEVFAKK